ncbi:MAG: hypothetical protein LW826_05135, partial [Candidatus Jidaibacter sp.]|nr:hypothetical protein [Candidatus Jidaibacter sp.]
DNFRNVSPASSNFNTFFLHSIEYDISSLYSYKYYKISYNMTLLYCFSYISDKAQSKIAITTSCYIASSAIALIPYNIENRFSTVCIGSSVILSLGTCYYSEYSCNTDIQK